MDALTINGNTAPVRRVYIRNSQFLWGPDVTAALLGDIAEVTLERCVIAEGLSESKHPEAPHSLGLNIASQDPTRPAQSISLIECLSSTCQSRNFRLIGVKQVELIGCTVYNHNEGPQGSPTSAMLLGCTWKKGPIALANTFRFRAQDGGHGAFSAKPNTVYEHGGADVGFSGSGVDGKVKAASPLFQTTEPEPDAAMAHQLVLGGAGAFPADKQLTRLRANVRAGRASTSTASASRAATPGWYEVENHHVDVELDMSEPGWRVGWTTSPAPTTATPSWTATSTRCWWR